MTMTGIPMKNSQVPNLVRLEPLTDSRVLVATTEG
jgi:hypothetical protein